MWILYAFASAFFAGVTAVLAKLGMEGVNSHLATALRTAELAVSHPVRSGHRRELAVLFSGAPAWGGQPGGPRG